MGHGQYSTQPTTCTNELNVNELNVGGGVLLGCMCVCVYNSYSTLFTVVAVCVCACVCVCVCVCACIYSSACMMHKHVLLILPNIIMNESHNVCTFVSAYTVCILFSQ